MEMTQYRWVQGWHMNCTGTLFGGTLLSWIDEDTMMLVTNMAKPNANFTTAGMERICFLKPVFAGQRLQLDYKACYIGKSSIWVYAEVFDVDDNEKVFSGYVCIVCVDAAGHPKHVNEAIDEETIEAIPKNECWNFVEMLRELHKKNS